MALDVRAILRGGVSVVDMSDVTLGLEGSLAWLITMW